MINLEELGITEKLLIENGFSVGTAYNIMRGKISKKSLLKLYELGLIERVERADKFIISNNNLFGEYKLNILKKELILIDNIYKIRLFLAYNDIRMTYILDYEDILQLNEKNIDILSINSVIAKIVGNKLKFIK